MLVQAIQTPQNLIARKGDKTLLPPFFALNNSFPSSSFVPRSITSSSCSLQFRESPWMHAGHRAVKRNALNVGTGSGDYEGRQENDNQDFSVSGTSNDISSQSEKPPNRILYLLSIALVLCGCALVFSLIAFMKGPSSLLAAITKSGFTAAFSLIFVSEIGNKTFFIAALLAMQYEKLLVLLGSMGALSLMTVLSVVIGRIFHSVPAQFQTTLPIGEYAAIALLMFFGLKSIKDAWDLPSTKAKTGDQGSDEYVEAEELVKDNVSKRLSNPLEVVWKSFSLVFFAEWGDRSMLATIALGAAQSPWGVASGAIVGHLLATSFAILGGAFLANYISEKLVGCLGGALFLGFAVPHFLESFNRMIEIQELKRQKSFSSDEGSRDTIRTLKK